MSFDIYLQRFRGGEACETDAQALEDVLAPHIAQRDDATGFALLRLPDGDAELYGVDDLASGFMINHASGLAVFDLIVDLARLADLAIMPVGCHAAVASAQALAELPLELAGDAVVVTSGTDLWRVVQLV